jgi:Ca-activated chloride channel family protein
MVTWSGAQGFGSLTARSPGTNQDFVPLWLKLMDAQVIINDQIAITKIDQTFKNTSLQRKEGIYQFSLPTDAQIIELALWINGIRCIAGAFQQTSAQSQYDNSVRKTVDPALLKKTGDNTYQINIFPIEANGDSLSERRIDFTYVQALKKQNDTLQFPFQLKTTELSELAPQRTSLAIQATFNDTITNIAAPGFLPQEISITQSSKSAFKFAYGNENAYCGKDMLLNIVIPQKSISMDALSYNPGIDTTMYFDSTGDPGYFMVRVNTPLPITNGVQKSRNVVIVMDASYSMAGDKFRQTKKAVVSVLNMLKPVDYFNIISFGTQYSMFDTRLNAATQTKINASINFLTTINPKGITNPVDALTQAFSSQWVSDSMRAVIFMTDGYPTWPIRRSSSSLIDTITGHNGAKVGLYSIGIGSTVDDQFLSLLSQRNAGFSVVLQPADTLFSQIGSMVQQMAFPVFGNITMDFGSLQASETYPSFPQTIIAGQQLNVFGRYTGAHTSNIIFSAQSGRQAILDTFTFKFPITKGNSHVVPQLWASAKISDLLSKIKLQGELNSLVQQVMSLGLRYHIVTPYTSLLVLAGVQTNGSPILDNLNKQKIGKTLFSLNYNPLESKVRIDYSVPMTGSIKNVSLKVFNLQGKLIKTLVQNITTGGHFVVFWDKSTEIGSNVGPGYFIIVLDVDNQRLVNSLRIVR